MSSTNVRKEIDLLNTYIATDFGEDFDLYENDSNWWSDARGFFYFRPPSHTGFFEIKIVNEDFLLAHWYDYDGTDCPVSDDDMYVLELALRHLAVPVQHPRCRSLSLSWKEDLIKHKGYV